MAKPGMIDRARLAAKVFRQGMPRSRVPQGTKKAPFIWPEFRRGKAQWHMLDFESYVTEGFYRNPLIYRAVMYKVYAKWLAPLRAYTGKLNNPVPCEENHPLARLVMRPNPYQSAMEFEALNIVYANLSGNCYMYLQRPKEGGLPEEMYSLRPDRVSIVPDPRHERGLLGYWYTPEGRSEKDGIPMRYQDVIHVKYPNPGDPLEGMGEGFSPVGPGAMSADVDNEATSFIKDFFERGLMPNVLLSFDVPLDDTDIAEVRDKWADIYGGSEGWLKPGVLGQGGSVERMGLTFDELGFEVLDERNETRILGPLGVPAVLIGARVGLANATYSNVVGLRRTFWEDVFVPELRMFETDFRHYLRGDDGAFVAYDTAMVPALQEDTPALVEAAYQMWQMGTPSNQAYRAVGLSVEPVDGGDDGYISDNMVPISMAWALEPQTEFGDEDDEPEAEPEDDEDEDTTADGEDGDDMENAEDDDDDADKAKFWADRSAEYESEMFPQDDEITFPLSASAIVRAEDEIRLMLAALTAEKQAALDGSRMTNWSNVSGQWLLEVAELTNEELALITKAQAEGWTIDQMARKVDDLPTKAHKPVGYSIVCPICGNLGADRYDDHGGLCVCQKCGKTFDPAVEM